MRARFAIAFVTLALLLGAVGCGGNDLVVGGMLPPSPSPATTPTATCVGSGGACVLNGDCCSGACTTFGTCA